MLDYLEDSTDFGKNPVRDEIFEMLRDFEVELEDPGLFDFEVLGPNADNEVEIIFSQPTNVELMQEILNSEISDKILGFDLLRGDLSFRIPWKVTQLGKKSMTLELIIPDEI